ncbi:hypothetical protein EJ04DRAFT_554283 [Polyplosphaeria fusca]|uniref:DUF7779 domain-containing protein n=1 Tax=Polyplosphaeria fusca TaxID=682080 RepID=A0A9P4UXF1_9PLEO|nr:hypothetical protein EJ04DRAFT_554283 [Polyplosphaeria fusca]
MSMQYFLNEVYRPPDNRTEILLVYIPDISHGKKPSSAVDWRILVAKLSPVPDRTAVHEYRHGINAKEPFSHLLESGASLFPELFDTQLPSILLSQACTPSVYLICDLLGGIIAKEAFARTLERRFRWKASLDTIRGVFLVGVPHIEQGEHRDRVAPLLRVKSVNDHILPQKIFSQIRRSSIGFKEVVSDLNPDFVVVSAYGSLFTKSSISSLFSRVSSSLPEDFVRIGLRGQESTIAVEEDLETIWHAKTPGNFHSYVLQQINKTQEIRARSSKSLPQDIIGGTSQVSSPESLGRVQRAATSSSGKLSQNSSYAILTPPICNSSSSRLSLGFSTRGSLPPCATVTLPFRYPESCLDSSRYFTGREEELTQMATWLLPRTSLNNGDHPLRYFCVSGLGGIGKSALAYQFAARYHDKYDVILIIKADSPHRLSESFRTLAFRLALLSETEQPSDADCREAVKAWLKRPHHMPASTISVKETQLAQEKDMLDWLLLFDNVGQWADLDPYWPYKGRGNVLATTRKPELLSHLGDTDCTNYLELKSLPDADAENLLGHYARQDRNQSLNIAQSTKDLTRRLGGLPLALIQVGSYIKDCKMSITAFCNAHSKESDLHFVYLDHHRAQDYESNLASVWMLQSPSGQSDRSLGLLYVMSLLDHEGVPEELLQPGTRSSNLAEYPQNEPEFIGQYRALISSSLIEKKIEEGGARFKMHEMVQKVTRAKIATNALLCKHVVDHVLGRLTARWPYIDRIYQTGTQGNIKRWGRCHELIPHVAVLSKAYFEFWEAGCLKTPSLDFAELIYEVSLYHIEKSQGEEALRALDLSESILAEARGTADLIEYDLRICRGRIGAAFVMRDKDTYFDYAEKEYDIEIARSGEPSARLANANMHMGIAYNFNSLWKEAERYLNESKRIRESMPGFKKDWLFSPLYQLAHNYYHRGKYAQAAGFLEVAIKDRVEAFQEADNYSVRTGALYYTLGDVRVRQGQEDQSFSLYTKAHAHFERTVGPTNPATLHSKYKMATQHVRLHSHPVARELLDDILLHYRRVPYLRPYICRAALLYARSLRAQNMDATVMLEEAVRNFNDFSKHEKRNASTISEEDAQSLVLYDYI